MNNPKDIVHTWFKKWEEGDFLNIPVTEDFKHTSPYGVIEGKKEYLQIVLANKEKFLGHRFVIRDEIYNTDTACVRYKTTNTGENFSIEVSEWYYFKDGLIQEIIAYYNINENMSNELD